MDHFIYEDPSIDDCEDSMMYKIENGLPFYEWSDSDDDSLPEEKIKVHKVHSNYINAHKSYFRRRPSMESKTQKSCRHSPITWSPRKKLENKSQNDMDPKDEKQMKSLVVTIPNE